MKRREMVRQLLIKDAIIEHWRDECLRLMRELTNLSQMKIERIPGEKEFAAMQAALDEISAHNEELIKKVADLTAENERLKKERDEALEKYHSALVRVTDYAVKEYYSYANRFPEDLGLKEEGAKE